MRRAAAFDPGTSQNSAALAIGEERGGMWRPIFLREWRGAPGRPLDMRLKEGPEAARIVREHGLDAWETDQYAWADIVLVSREHALQIKMDNAPLAETFTHARRVLHEGRMALGGPASAEAFAELERLGQIDPLELAELCGALEEEMRGITEKREGGKTVISLPVVGRRHADLARAWIRCLWSARAGEAARPGHSYGTGEHRYGSTVSLLESRLAR